MTQTRHAIENQLENALRTIGIPPRPAILDRISAEMDRDEPDFKHLASLIAADVALSASLISITNSPYFGFRGRVNSPGEALMVLGLNVASKAIAGIVMRRAFPESPQLERFWDTSARIARLSGWLAQRYTTLRADDAYTFGLFRDCGIPILLHRFPDYTGTLNAANHEEIRSFTAIEELSLPTNHAIVGTLLAQSWWLSDETSTAVRHHHDAEILLQPVIPPTLNSRYMIAVAQLAEYLLQQHSGQCFDREWQKLGPACLRLLDLAEADLQQILDDASPVIEAEA